MKTAKALGFNLTDRLPRSRKAFRRAMRREGFSARVIRGASRHYYSRLRV